jgi:uncharacterized membrane protein YdbT with pleckstrin-like domain
METGVERAIEDNHPKRHDPGSPNAASESLEKLPFRLQHGENIIRELKPQFLGFMLTRGIGSYMAIFGLAVAIILALLIIKTNIAGFITELVLLPLLIIFLVLVISLKPLIQYGKSWYWITNHRVIGKRGFLGYSINSIPLENVSDVVLTRTLLDRILGLSSLVIVSMGNDPMTEGGTGSSAAAQYPNFFPALTQETAREMQRVLFNLRDDLKAPWRADSVAMVPQPAPMPAPEQSARSSIQPSVQPRRKSSRGLN